MNINYKVFNTNNMDLFILLFSLKQNGRHQNLKTFATSCNIIMIHSNCLR